MWIELIQNILISVVVIFLVHYTWNYLKENYTTKKTKDLVGLQIQKYKSIIDEIQKNKAIEAGASWGEVGPGSEPVNTGSSGFLSEEDKNEMNEELLKFVMQKIEGSS